VLFEGVNILEESTVRGIAPPGQEGWREAPGWLLKTLFWNNHPVCAVSVADAAFS
jgi:hypothetical protein